MLGDDEESPTGSPRPERPPTALSRHAIGRKDRSSSERRSRKSSSPTPMTKRDEVLMNEFEKVSVDKPETITFDQVELERGLLRFSWVGKPDPKGRTGGVTAGILVSFPLGYPAAAPTFLVTNSSNEVDKNHILKSLRNVAQQNAKKNETCLLACINMFVSIMQSIKSLGSDSSTEFPTIGVSNVPFPRTSGARFCSVGMLVCFGRPTYLRRIKSNTDSGTPRSLSALGPFLSQLAHEEDGRSRRSRRLEKKKANIVTVFDVTPMLPFNRGLGENYTHIVPSPFLRKTACTQNASTARNSKKQGVANTWQAAAIVADFSNDSLTHRQQQLPQPVHDVQMPEEDDDEASWISYHPLGSDLVHSMITHYAKHGDVQTAGTMACLFTTVDPNTFHPIVGLGARVSNEPGHPQKCSVTAQNKHLKPPPEPNICQIRLDFTDFMAASANFDGLCETDRLKISNSITVSNDFVTCGNLNGQHMYLTFGSQDMIEVTPILKAASSRYKIVATRIPCDSKNRAPDYCLQYFTKPSDIVKSFDYGGQQQDSQQYTACVKPMAQSTNVRWAPCAGGNGKAFDIVTNLAGGTPVCNTDWVQIKGQDKVCETFSTTQPSTWKPYDLLVNFDEKEYPPPPPSFFMPVNPDNCQAECTPQAGFIDCSCINGVLPAGQCQCIVDMAAAGVGGAAPMLGPDMNNTGFCLEYTQL